MFLLFETPTGFALLKKIKKNPDKDDFNLHSFYRYNSKSEACKSIESIRDNKVPRTLKQFLMNSSDKNQSLIINDYRLKKNLLKKIGPFFKKILTKKKIFRNIRNSINENKQIENFFGHKKILTITHTLYNRKLKFSCFKIDKIVIYIIRLLEELEKELNIYSQRLKEWYSWHFPEIFTIISDNVLLAKIISRFETRDKLDVTDMSDILSSDLIEKIVEASEVSLGVKIHEDDLACILSLCSQIIFFCNFKSQIQSYLKNRMYKIAPNLTAITGEKVGAKLILHAGSLLNLAKCHASKIQIFGAEKALFRAIKSKTNTPKYGLIFNVNCLNTADKRIKGKISRILSSKIALSARIDALGETKYGGSVGVKNRLIIEKKIKQLNSFLEKY